MRPAPSAAIALLLSATALAGCKVDNRPLLARLTGAPPPPAAGLPQPGGPYEASLPPTPDGAPYPPPPPPQPVRYEPARAWPDAEQAYALDQAFYDVPPDYGFDYVDEQPWAWQAADDSLMFAEPYGDAYRFYYYRPGAAYPDFVEGPDYGYAFGSDGALIALFDAAGALLPSDDYDRYYPQARQTWTRGYDLRRAYAESPRRAVDRDAWSRRAPEIARVQQPWIRAGANQPAWRQWRAGGGGDLVQRYAPERARRLAMAATAGPPAPALGPVRPGPAFARIDPRMRAQADRQAQAAQMAQARASAQARMREDARTPPRPAEPARRFAQARMAAPAPARAQAFAEMRAERAAQAMQARQAVVRQAQVRQAQVRQTQVRQRAMVAPAAPALGRNVAWRGPAQAAVRAAPPRPQAQPQARPQPQAHPEAHPQGQDGHGAPGVRDRKHGR